MPSQQEDEVFTEADNGEEMKQTSPSKIINRSTLLSTTIINNKNNNGNCTTTNSNNDNNNNEKTDITIINYNNNIPKNTENYPNSHSSHHTTTTIGANQNNPSRNNDSNNNNNNSFIIISDDTNGHTNRELINNIHHMISNTNTKNNNSNNKNLQKPFMNEYHDAPYTSSSSNISNFTTFTSIPSTNNVNNTSMNSYVSSNNLNFKNFTPTIPYAASNNNNKINNNNDNNNPNCLVPFTPSNNNYNNNNPNVNVVRPFPKQIPTFNNPQLNVLTPQVTNNSRQKPPTQQQLDNREVEIEKIVTRKFADGKMFYRIQWEGYPKNCNSWFSAEQLDKYKDVLDEHDRRNRKLTEVLSSSPNPSNNEPLPSSSVDPFIAGNALPQPRPLPKKIKLDPDIPNGWTPQSTNNRNPTTVHNYSSHPYPSQHGLQRAPPQNMPSGISQQNFYTPSISANNNNGNPDMMLTNKYNGIFNYATHENNNITRIHGNNLFGSRGNIHNNVGPIYKPNMSPWGMQTQPTQFPVSRVVRPIPKILSIPTFPALLPISSIDYVHKGNMTTFTIKFSPSLKKHELTFERKQVSILTQTNNNGSGKKSSLPIPPNTPISNVEQRNLSSLVSPSFPPSTSSTSQHAQPKSVACNDQNGGGSPTTIATNNKIPASSSGPPVSQLHPLDPLIIIDEIICMNGTEVIVLATLEKENQKKYFPVNDVFKVFPEYLYCFVLNETLRLRPNCVNLT